MKKQDKKYFLSQDHQNENPFGSKADSIIYKFLQQQYLRSGLNFGKCKGNQYISIFDFVLQEGHFYKPEKLTKTETMIITDVTLRPKFKLDLSPNACFFNSRL